MHCRHGRLSSQLPTTVLSTAVLSLIVQVLYSFGQQKDISFILLPFVESLTTPLRPNPQERIHKLLIVGLGRVGLQVADMAVSSQIPIQENEKQKFVQVVGTVRQSSLALDKDSGCSQDDNILRIPFDPKIVRKHLFGYDDDDNNNKNNNGVEYSIPVSHVLFTIPLSRETDPVMEAVLNEIREWWKTQSSDDDDDDDDGYGYGYGYGDGNRKINRHPSKVLGILSTTGVYGNHNGNIVNEDSPLLCEEDSNAELYRRFENKWITFCDREEKDEDKDANRLCIFRCAGIYDSSSSALHTVFRQGVGFDNVANVKTTATATATNVVAIPRSMSSKATTGNKTNRIHSVDLARGVLAGMFQQNCNENENRNGSMSNSIATNRIYNLADNLPESRPIVLSFARELLSSIYIPLTEDVTTTATATTTTKTNTRSSVSRQNRRARESKVVCNKRMRQLLSGNVFFPTYREGLNEIFNDPTTPWRR
jgi:hypothetical protein